jgi:hypothetical protein
VWKAEFQERGALHYHLLQSEFVPWYVLRWKWNSVMKKAGYLKQWALEHKNFNPPSIDIHSVWKVGNVAAYIAKYMSKEGPGPVQKKGNGKIWDASTDVKVKRFSYPLDYQTESNIFKYVKQNPCSKVECDRCTIINNSKPVALLSAGFKNKYQLWKN